MLQMIKNEHQCSVCHKEMTRLRVDQYSHQYYSNHINRFLVNLKHLVDKLELEHFLYS